MQACNSCGKCCIKYGDGGLSASEEDLGLWQSERPDIDRFTRDGIIWVDPESGEQLAYCPWLRKEPGQTKYSCAIYYDRPEDCRVYPASIADMVKDECEMLEPLDLANTKVAQQKLQKLMIAES